MKKWLYVAAAVLCSGIILLLPRADTAPSGTDLTGARLEEGAPREGSPVAIQSGSDSTTPDSTTGEGELTPRQFLEEQLRLNTLDAFVSLANVYGDWTSRPDLGPLRREILQAFARHEDRRQRVGLLLTAAGQDTVSPEEDPNWELLVHLLTPQWDDPETYSLGRDLVLLVESERARRLVVDSLVSHVEEAEERVTPEERAALAGDFIDAYFRAKDEGLRQSIRDGVGSIGGEELAEALSTPVEEARETAPAE